MGQVMVATESFHARDADTGNPVVVYALQTLLDSDDDVVRRFPQYFKPATDVIRPTVEEATASPGALRGEPATAVAAPAAAEPVVEAEPEPEPEPEPVRRGPGRPRKNPE